MLRVVSFLILFSLVGIGSCSKEEIGSKDNSQPCSKWRDMMVTEKSAMTQAMTELAVEPSRTNCKISKDATLAYIDKAKIYLNCPAMSQSDRDELSTAIAAAEDSLKEMNCDEEFILPLSETIQQSKTDIDQGSSGVSLRN